MSISVDVFAHKRMDTFIVPGSSKRRTRSGIFGRLCRWSLAAAISSLKEPRKVVLLSAVIRTCHTLSVRKRNGPIHGQYRPEMLTDDLPNDYYAMISVFCE